LTVLVTVAAALTGPAAIPDTDPDGRPHLRSETALVRLVDTGEVVLARRPEVVRPIASVTKLLAGLLLAELPVEGDPLVTILDEDKDRLKWSRSRVVVGSQVPWSLLVHAAVTASDNRCMYAAVRARMTRGAFVARMNERAASLGMRKSRFVDPAGVDPGNVSTATDLLLLLEAAARDGRLRAWSTAASVEVPTARGTVTLTNPDRLARSPTWETVVGKTGYTVEAGRTLLVRVRVHGREVDMAFLGSREMQSVFGDAARVKRWLGLKLMSQPEGKR
jgi:D-alanyl-D-alanine endopeptidase (penicillin-binding protein 7)